MREILAAPGTAVLGISILRWDAPESSGTTPHTRPPPFGSLKETTQAYPRPQVIGPESPLPRVCTAVPRRPRVRADMESHVGMSWCCERKRGALVGREPLCHPGPGSDLRHRGGGERN